MTTRRTARARSRQLARRLAARVPIRLHAKPDFLIIGAQKAGTTSLYAWITGHPDVLPARSKELHFFDLRAEPVPIESYWPNFPSRARISRLRRVRGRSVVTGEATPSYLFDPRVPSMVFDHLPAVKLIVLLRDPVDRAISHYWMAFNSRVETLSLEEALSAEWDRLEPDLVRLENGEPAGQHFRWASYVSRGRYADQLGNWLALYPRDQLLVIEFAELAIDPISVYRRTLNFLGVDPDIAPPPSFAAEHVGSKSVTNTETVRWLREQFVESNRRLAELVGIDYNVNG